MKTTEFIDLLEGVKYGGASGKAREVYFDIGDMIVGTDGAKISSTGDGMFAEVFIDLPDHEHENACMINRKELMKSFCKDCKGIEDPLDCEYFRTCKSMKVILKVKGKEIKI